MVVGQGYRVSPGCCHVCRVARPGPVIDTQRDDPGPIKRTNIYLCASCVIAMMDMLDGLTDYTLIRTTDLADLGTDHIHADQWQRRALRAEAILADAVEHYNTVTA